MGTALSALAELSEIATAIVAVSAATFYSLQRARRRHRLEAYLAKERKDGERSDVQDTGARSITHLMGHLSMTEAQVLEAGFASGKVVTLVGRDPDSGRADWLMFKSKHPPSN